MQNLTDFIKHFFKNKGQHVFVSLLIAKICAFLGSLFIIRLLPENEFGVLSIAASIFAIFVPFSGFGSTQSLLRFGAISQSEQDKKELSDYLFRRGFFYQILLSFIFLAASVFYVSKYEYIFWIFLCFAVRLLGTYFFMYVQSKFRISGNNREFAKVGNAVNIGFLALLILLTYFFGLKGYLVAVAASPFISMFWYKHFKNNFSPRKIFNFNKKELWSYALHSSGTALLSDALFSADILLLSFLMNETAVAHYKVAILIPANITFLSLTFMQSDFPILAKNYKNKMFLKHYISNYYKLFIPICILIFGIGFFFGKEILHLFFKEQYADNSFIFSILLAAFCANMLFRNLYGNLLSAVGLMKNNTTVSVFTLLVLSALSFLLVPNFGLKGMAISMASALTFSGFILMFYFLVYLKRLK
ncbi:MAG: oligosaccharide flippase family protein [Flavobacteriaceae bacterium]|jgi:O-antigen/teichoic acid export membrane protein|nr:oligosaccharide flippase family protein [Flavobacteriaceae bacterium]